jgi:hypothetical protein
MILLEHLKSICINLNSSERRQIRSNLKNDSLSADTSLMLFDNICNSSESTFELLSTSIYGKINYEALKKLIQRLIDKISDLLISKDLIIDSDLFDSTAIERLNVRRKLVQYDVIYRHGASKYTQMLLESVLKTCREIEYYDYLIIGLEKKLNRTSLANGVGDYKKVFKEIEYFTDCNMSLKRSKYLLRYYFSESKYKQSVFTINELKRSVDILKLDMERTKSNSVKFYYHLLKSLLLDSEGKINDSKKNFIVLHKFVLSKPQIFNSTDFFIVVSNIANCELCLFNFDSSLRFINAKSPSVSKLYFNKKMLIELEFLNYYYKGDLLNCQTIIESLVQENKYITMSPYIIEKRYFYQASLAFVKRDFKLTIDCLNKCRNLEKDKSGWNIGVRLLFILAHIELNRLNLVESLIENFRKHLSRVNGTDVSPRFSIILRILVLLEKESFNFAKAQPKCSNQIFKLFGGDRKYRAQLKSPEMIIFHEWFESKVSDVNYDHSRAIERLRKVSLK